MQAPTNVASRPGLVARLKAAVPLSIKARLSRNDGLRPTQAGVWDKEFAAGQWDFLGGPAEMPRYAAIAGYFQRGGANRVVVDIGCGNGVLQPWLRRAGYERYIGIDLSAAAIEQAQSRAGDDTSFAAGDAETYVPPVPADVIIFNEMLYYMNDPTAVLRRYAGHLAAGGCYIVSLWHCRESWRTWQRCRGAVELLDETQVTRAGVSWSIRLCRPVT